MTMFSWPLTLLMFLSAAVGVVFTAAPVTAFLMLQIDLPSTRPVELTQARGLRVVGRTAPALTVRTRGELLTR